MFPSLLPFFEWAQSTGAGTVIRNSTWLFPLVETVHLFGLVLVFGATLVLNLRVLGFFLPSQPAPEIAQISFSWFWRGLVLSIPTGALLFLATAMKCYNNPPFHLKMLLLGLAITFQATVHRKLSMREKPDFSQKLAGAASLLMWVAIPALGFWIEIY